MMLGPISDSLLDGLSGVIDELADFIDTTTNPQPLDASFLRPQGPYHAVASFSAAVLVGFIFLSVAYGLLTGAPGQVLIRLLRDIPLAVLAIIGFPWLVAQLVDLSNALSATVLPAGDTAKDLLTISLLENLKGMGTANLVPSVLIGLLTFAATVLVYLELVVRVILLQLVEALAPLSFAPMVWAPAREAARKVVELTVAVVLSQPAIFLALRIGLDFLHEHASAAPGDLGAWAKLLLGLGVVSVATFSPWVIWRLLPHAEGMIMAQGLSRSPGRAAMGALQTAYWVSALRSAGTRGAPALAAAGAGSGIGPPRSLPFPRPGIGTGRGRPSPGSPPAGSQQSTPAGGSPNPAGGSGTPTGSSSRTDQSSRTAPTARQPPAPQQQASSAPAQQPPPGRSASAPPATGTAGNPPNGGVAPGWSRRRPPT